MKKNINKTKIQISESFINLLNEYYFDKITIKMITDKAGIIRPTFYNHFQDKYELIKWILQNNIFNSANKLVDNNMPKEALLMILKIIENNRNLYKKLFKIEGKNSFQKIFSNELYILILNIIKNIKIKDYLVKEVFTKEIIALYYSNSITITINFWITNDTENKYSSKDIISSYEFILSNSLYNLLDNE